MSQKGLSFYGEKNSCKYCVLPVSVHFKYCQHCGGYLE